MSLNQQLLPHEQQRGAAPEPAAVNLAINENQDADPVEQETFSQTFLRGVLFLTLAGGFATGAAYGFKTWGETEVFGPLKTLDRLIIHMLLPASAVVGSCLFTGFGIANLASLTCTFFNRHRGNAVRNDIAAREENRPGNRNNNPT